MTKNITKEIIINEAVKLIAENGLSSFSLHDLAGRLKIKTASLYTHISGKDEIITEAGIKIINSYKAALEKAVKDKKRAEALLALSNAKRSWAKENPALYELIMNMQLIGNERLAGVSKIIIEPLEKILDGYSLSDEQKTDLERMFRAATHGFISQEEKGYFSHFSRDADKSYAFTVTAVINEIEAAENENS